MEKAVTHYRWLRTLPVALGTAVLAGCVTVPSQTPPLKPQAPPVVAQPGTQSMNGSLFIPGGHVSLFQDHRLWHPGDLVTIDIAQDASASTNDSGDMQHSSSAKAGISDLFGLAHPHIGGIQGTGLSPSIGASSNFASKGTGSNAASNSVEAHLTAMVIKVEANGVLEIAGRTNVNVDGDVRSIEITGFVRSQDIGPDNTVSSDAIADANVQYVGTGPMQQAHHIPGGLRWLEKIWPF